MKAGMERQRNLQSEWTCLVRPSRYFSPWRRTEQDVPSPRWNRPSWNMHWSFQDVVRLPKCGRPRRESFPLRIWSLVGCYLWSLLHTAQPSPWDFRGERFCWSNVVDRPPLQWPPVPLARVPKRWQAPQLRPVWRSHRHLDEVHSGPRIRQI